MRRWALWVAVAALVLVVAAAVGGTLLIAPQSLAARIRLLQQHPSAVPGGVGELADLRAADFGDGTDPPGLAIGCLALTGALMALLVVLMVLPTLIGHRAGAVVNGIASVVAGLCGALGGIVLALLALAALILRVTLFLAAPFGTLAYLAIYGFFDVAAAAAVLGVILVLQIVAVVFLVVADRRVLGNKRLMWFLLLSILLTIVVMILHAIVPGILASITDALAAVIVAVVGILWAVAVLVGGVVALVKQLAPGKQGDGPLRERDAAAGVAAGQVSQAR